ncbi:MAG: Ig-like domain-containing protein, partial [Eubacteriales bacterium]
VNDAAKTITYTPQADWNGEFVITYRVTDDGGLFDTGTIIVTVNPVGDAPVLSPDSFTVNEDEFTASQATPWYSMDVLANDTDVDEITNSAFEDLLITAVNFIEDNVRLVISTDKKTINFQSDEDWNGVVSFTYTVTDAYGISRTESGQMTVNQVNDNPVSADDTASTNEDTPITFSIIANDYDVDTDAGLNQTPGDDSISINESDVLGVAHGSISLTNGVLTYTPDENWNGVETLTYTLLDEHGGTDTATITINVAAVNDNPQASDDGASLNEDDTFYDIYPLVNDYNPDSDNSLNAVPDTRPLEIQSINLAGMPSGAGTITIVDDHLHYIPDPNYEGTFTISYTCVNGNGATDTADITIYVQQIYDDPVATDHSDSMDEDGVYSYDMESLVSDVDAGTTFTFTIITNGAHGTASIDAATHELTYTPDADYNGEDTIEYMVQDNQLLSDTATITITINQVNDAPITNDDTASSNEDVAVTINVLANDSDIDTDLVLNAVPSAERITVKEDGFIGVDNGTVTVLSNETSILFTPDANWHGTEVFTYTCIDVTGVEVQADVTVTIDPVNDVPVFNRYNTTLSEDTSISYSASTLIFDPDIASAGDLITLIVVTEPTRGTLEIDTNNKVTYTPDANFNGDDAFTIEAEDSLGESSTETFRMNVTQVNDKPVAKGESVSTNEDTKLSINVLENDSDIDMRTGLNKYPYQESLAIYELGITQPEHGKVTVDGTMLIYEPDKDYYGIDSFEYSVIDNSGATSKAEVEVLVKSVVDIPVLIGFTTPYKGDAYKSGYDLPVGWYVENPDNLELLYKLSFFDGSKWIVIGEGLSAEEYSHIIEEYIVETDKAQFSVYGVMTDGKKTNTIYSDVFIVDNAAPINTEYSVSQTEGSGDPPIMVTVKSGEDMIEFEYMYSLTEGGDRIIIDNNQFLINPEDQEVFLYACDKLGNMALVDSIRYDSYSRRFTRSSGGSGAPIAAAAGLAGAMIILLILVSAKNIKFVFTYAEGKTKTISMLRRHKESGIDIKLKEKMFDGAISVDMAMKKKLTEKMLGSNVRVFKGGGELKFVQLPERHRGRFTDRII